MRVNVFLVFFFFQAEDGIRDLVRSRGLGDVYKRQPLDLSRRPRRVGAQRNRAGVEPARPARRPGLGDHGRLSLIHI